MAGKYIYNDNLNSSKAYGYGGIKMCPTSNFRKIKDDKIDPIAEKYLKMALEEIENY